MLTIARTRVGPALGIALGPALQSRLGVGTRIRLGEPLGPALGVGTRPARARTGRHTRPTRMHQGEVLVTHPAAAGAGTGSGAGASRWVHCWRRTRFAHGTCPELRKRGEALGSHWETSPVFAGESTGVKAQRTNTGDELKLH
jgi:hypothetical protein